MTLQDPWRGPRNYRTPSGLDLADWLTTQRKAYRAGKLTPARATALEQLGIGWDRRAVTFAAGLAHLRTFHGTHGHTSIPPGYHTSGGFALHGWLPRQRHAHRTGNLPPSQAEALQALGVQWRPPPPSWHDSAAALATYVTEHGHTRVPRTHITPSGIKLGLWIHQQRQRRRNPGRNQTRPLTSDQITTLDHLGMIWTPTRTPQSPDSQPTQPSQAQQPCPV